MWKENIKEIHPILSEEEKKVFYKNLSNILIDIYSKYKKEKNT